LLDSAPIAVNKVRYAYAALKKGAGRFGTYRYTIKGHQINMYTIAYNFTITPLHTVLYIFKKYKFILFFNDGFSFT
jgi:hypothetical protein